MKKWINILFTLGKVKITFFVTLTCSFGYILADGRTDLYLFISSFGVFILSAGCSALNQYQERFPDSLMNRTMKRPIPANDLTPSGGLIISATMIAIGLLLLLTIGLLPFLLGVSAIIWYNGIYTPLKMITPLAVIPGAIIGAIPPIIGWVSGGGDILSPKIIAMAFFFFIWQIPHFWLLLLIFDKDYERGGFPTLTKIFSHIQLRRITYVWIVALVASCMVVPLFEVSRYEITNLLLFLAGFVLIWRTKNLLEQYESAKIIKFAFMNVNFYVLIVVILLSLDKFIY